MTIDLQTKPNQSKLTFNVNLSIFGRNKLHFKHLLRNLPKICGRSAPPLLPFCKYVNKGSKQTGQGDLAIPPPANGMARGRIEAWGSHDSHRHASATQTGALKTAAHFLGVLETVGKGTSWPLASLLNISNYKNTQFLLVCPPARSRGRRAPRFLVHEIQRVQPDARNP